jgi:outer membrane protein assembly factor BamB/predicted phosphodiesterase
MATYDTENAIMPDVCRLAYQIKSAAWAILVSALLSFHAAAAPEDSGPKTDASQPSASFSFAWLSDTHVGSTSGEEDLRASVSDINSQTNLSFVIISGDVTEFGSLEQLRLAKEILDGLKIPCHVVPGNHDTKWSESGATDFSRLWKEDRFVFEFGGFRFIGLHEGPLMKMGDGHWAPEDVRWLRKTLSELRNPKQPLIFVTHYPIDTDIANWFVVLDVLKKHNIQAALCGHVHRNSTNSFEGVPGITGRTNLRGTAPTGGYTLVEVKDGRQMTFSERVLSMTSQPDSRTVRAGNPATHSVTDTSAPTGRTELPWCSILLQQHDFASDTNKYPRPDFSINQQFPAVKERWRRETGWTIASTPALRNDLAIVGDASGTIHAYAVQSGQTQWEFKTGSAVYSSADVSGDLLVCPSTDGIIYGLKASTGKEAWRYTTSRPIVASPRIADGVAYVGSSEGKFRALHLASGKLLWEFDRIGGFVETRPLIYDGKVIFGAWDQYLYALDSKTGKLVWKWKGDGHGTMLAPAACWPVGAAGKIFIVAPDRRMTAVDEKTGTQIWRTRDYMVRESLGASEDQSRFYIRSMQDFFYAFSTGAAQPEKVWESNGGFGYDINSAMLVEKGGAVFYGTKNGLLFAIDSKTGAIKWQHKVGVALINTVAPLNDHQVITADFDGNVVLVDAGTSS